MTLLFLPGCFIPSSGETTPEAYGFGAEKPDFKFSPCSSVVPHSQAIDLNNHRVYAPELEENGSPAANIAVFEAVP